jgi:hypothetical protein
MPFVMQAAAGFVQEERRIRAQCVRRHEDELRSQSRRTELVREYRRRNISKAVAVNAVCAIMHHAICNALGGSPATAMSPRAMPPAMSRAMSQAVAAYDASCARWRARRACRQSLAQATRDFQAVPIFANQKHAQLLMKHLQFLKALMLVKPVEPVEPVEPSSAANAASAVPDPQMQDEAISVLLDLVSVVGATECYKRFRRHSVPLYAADQFRRMSARAAADFIDAVEAALVAKPV